MKELDEFYLSQEEPVRSCLLGLKNVILELDDEVTTAWKYGGPFFCFRGKNICYLWVDKKTKWPYIGVVEGHRFEHPILEKGDRKQIKIIRINPEEDFPIEDISLVLNWALDLYKKGIIKTKK